MKKFYALYSLPEQNRPKKRLRKVGVDNLSVQEFLCLTQKI